MFKSDQRMEPTTPTSSSESGGIEHIPFFKPDLQLESPDHLLEHHTELTSHHLDLPSGHNEKLPDLEVVDHHKVLQRKFSDHLESPYLPDSGLELIDHDFELSGQYLNSLELSGHDLELPDHNLEPMNYSLEPMDHSLEPTDHSLEPTDHSLEQMDHNLELDHNLDLDHNLEVQDRSLDFLYHGLELPDDHQMETADSNAWSGPPNNYTSASANSYVKF
jgi:hypothetical protein